MTRRKFRKVSLRRSNIMLLYIMKGLDECCGIGEARAAMKTTPILAAAIALLSLSACEKKSEVVTSTAPDPQEEALKNAAPVSLPPALTASVSLRCGDNSLIYVDFYKGETQAVVKTTKDGAPTVLKAPASGEPYVADGGWKLTGNAKAISVTTPGKPARSCHA